MRRPPSTPSRRPTRPTTRRARPRCTRRSPRRWARTPTRCRRPSRPTARRSPPRRRDRASAHAADDLHELVALVAAAAGEPDERAGVRDDLAARGGPGADPAAPAAEVAQALVAPHPQRGQHRVAVDPEDRGDVLRGREALTGSGLSVRDRAADRGGGLVGQADARRRAAIDGSHKARDTSFMLARAALPIAPPGRLRALFEE